MNGGFTVVHVRKVSAACSKGRTPPPGAGAYPARPRQSSSFHARQMTLAGVSSPLRIRTNALDQIVLGGSFPRKMPEAMASRSRPLRLVPRHRNRRSFCAPTHDVSRCQRWINQADLPRTMRRTQPLADCKRPPHYDFVAHAPRALDTTTCLASVFFVGPAPTLAIPPVDLLLLESPRPRTHSATAREPFLNSRSMAQSLQGFEFRAEGGWKTTIKCSDTPRRSRMGRKPSLGHVWRPKGFSRWSIRSSHLRTGQ